MQFDFTYLLYGLFGLGCFLLVEGVYFLVIDVRGRKRDPNRRLRMLSGGASRESVLISLRREKAISAGGGPIAWFANLVVQSGIRLRPIQIGLLMLALGAAGFVAAVVTERPIAISVGIGVGLGLAVPTLLLMFLRRRRIARFEQQFPDAVDMAVRGLRAGHPVATAMSIVAKEMTDPVGSEFGIALDEMTYGLDLERALKNMEARVGMADLNFMVVAVTIQQQLGGNLAEVLNNLARVMRERLRMKLKIKAASAEGRFSAFVLSVTPFVLMGIISVLNPAYYGEVEADPIFFPALEVAFVLMLFGIFVMYRMVSFRV